MLLGHSGSSKKICQQSSGLAGISVRNNNALENNIVKNPIYTPPTYSSIKHKCLTQTL